MADNNSDDDAKKTDTTTAQDGQKATDQAQQSDTGAAEDKDWKAEAEKWRALARKHEGTAKANSTAAQELATIKDAQKTAEQRLNDQLAAAQVELAEYRTRETRTSAVLAVGLPPEMAEYITEAEPDSALEQAKRLAEHLKPAAQKPAADLRQGARGGPAQQADDPNAWLRHMAGRA